MTLELDPVTKKFIDLSVSFRRPVLEIGTAFGVSTLPLLEKTEVDVIANDLSPENLLVLRKQSSTQVRSRLFLNNQSFPHDLHLDAGTLSGVLMVRVAHFLKGEDFDAGLAKIYDWLAPGGIVAIVTATPYQKNIQSFMKTYAARSEARMKWPGYLEDYPGIEPSLRPGIKRFLHVMDHTILIRALRDRGFLIMEHQYIDRKSFFPEVALDGREGVGIIAKKPE